MYVYIYIYRERERENVEIIDFGESDSMIEICGKLDKSNNSNRFRRNDISGFFISF